MLRFSPFYQPALWGGRLLAEIFGRPLPDGPVGESWELVELPERHSRVRAGGEGGAGSGQEGGAGSGQEGGALLGDLWRAGRLGGSACGPFPFLLKWIDARQSLSVQVHPDEEACERLGHGRPKTEAWYVHRAEPGAHLLIGHYPGLDGASLRQAALGGTLQKWLYETQPRVGDMFLLKSGTLHAIGAGMLLLEIQQPSDTTFRIYDFGRVGADGKPRALHLDEAAASVTYPLHGPAKALRREARGPCFHMQPLAVGTRLDPGLLRAIAACSEGTRLQLGTGEEVSLGLGEVVVAEASDGPLSLLQGAAIWLSEAQPEPG